MNFRPVGITLVADASSGIGAAHGDRLARCAYGVVLAARDIERLKAIRVQSASGDRRCRPPASRSYQTQGSGAEPRAIWSEKIIPELEEPS
jgi:NAD(P)-dependent dehydrogenase (short-subunit alcohol dehydrogenase family)